MLEEKKMVGLDGARDQVRCREEIRIIIDFREKKEDALKKEEMLRVKRDQKRRKGICFDK